MTAASVEESRKVIQRTLSYPAPTLTEREKAMLALDDLVAEVERLRGQMQAGFARERKLAALFAEAQK